MAVPFWLTKLLVRTGLARFTPRAARLTDGAPRFVRHFSDRVLAAPVDELLDPAYVPDTCGPEVTDLNPAFLRSESGVSLGRLTGERRGNPPPSGLPELRQAIAARYRRLDGRTVDPNDILVTHGASGALAAAFDAFVNPGDRVVLFDPCSPLFALAAKSRRATIRWVPTWNEDGRCRYLSAVFEKAMRGAKLLVFSDPGNPCGSSLAEEDLEHALWFAAAYRVLIVVDETFGRFRYGPRPRSAASLAGADQRLLTVGSLTAEFGLGSLRVGWVAGPRPLVRAIGLVQNLTAPFVPAVCQQAAARVLAEDDPGFDGQLDRLRGKRDYALERLKQMGIEAERPAGGLFLWVPVAGLGLDGRAFAERLFREERVKVGPGYVYGPGGTGQVRIGFAGDDGRLREGLNRMAAFVTRLRNPAAPRPVEADMETPAGVVADEAPGGPAPEATPVPRPSFSRV